MLFLKGSICSKRKRMLKNLKHFFIGLFVANAIMGGCIFLYLLGWSICLPSPLPQVMAVGLPIVSLIFLCFSYGILSLVGLCLVFIKIGEKFLNKDDLPKTQRKNG